jgi:pimeloyl-ACP methyl ester carboxylesterase
VIEDFLRSQQPARRIIFREALACLALGAIYPLGIKKSGKRTRRLKEQRTIVFIHGYLSNPSAFFPLAAYLQSIESRQVLFFPYRSGGGIERAAIGLRDFLKERVRGGRIDLVCHSLGGVIARVYLEALGGFRKVDRCITLGTPHRGTYNSYWVRTRVGAELRPDSALLRRLTASQGPLGQVRYTSIVGGTDNIVIPRVFAIHEETVHIPDVGHIGLLFCPRVFFEIARRLTPTSRAARCAGA